MLTNNEEKTIKLIYSNSDISLRKIVSDLDLGGVASASYIINSLEKKGYIKRVGVATSKKYQLTEKSLAFFEVVTDAGSRYSVPLSPVSTFSATISSIDSKSASTGKAEEFQQFSTRDFSSDGANGVGVTGENFRKIVSATFAKIINSPAGIDRYGDAVVLLVVLTTIVLPISYFLLKEKWLDAFTPIALLIAAVILNKK